MRGKSFLRERSTLSINNLSRARPRAAQLFLYVRSKVDRLETHESATEERTQCAKINEAIHEKIYIKFTNPREIRHTCNMINVNFLRIAVKNTVSVDQLRVYSIK